MSLEFTLELVGSIFCLVVCLIHFVVQFVTNKKLGKKINALCKHCGMPVFDKEEHNCSVLRPSILSDDLPNLSTTISPSTYNPADEVILSVDELKALAEFLEVFRGSKRR